MKSKMGLKRASADQKSVKCKLKVNEKEMKKQDHDICTDH